MARTHKQKYPRNVKCLTLIQHRNDTPNKVSMLLICIIHNLFFIKCIVLLFQNVIKKGSNKDLQSEQLKTNYSIHSLYYAYIYVDSIHICREKVQYIVCTNSRTFIQKKAQKSTSSESDLSLATPHVVLFDLMFLKKLEKEVKVTKFTLRVSNDTLLQNTD